MLESASNDRLVGSVDKFTMDAPQRRVFVCLLLCTEENTASYLHPSLQLTNYSQRSKKKERKKRKEKKKKVFLEKMENE